MAGRDHRGEIDVALESVLGTRPLVRVEAGERAGRTVEFAPGPPGSQGPWLDRRTVVPDGDVLRVRLDDGAGTEAARDAAGHAGRLVPDGRVAVRVPEPADPALVAAVVDGLASGYSGPQPLTLVVTESEIEAAIGGVLAADVVRLARLLTSAPPNLLTPSAAAGWAQQIADATGLDCLIRTGDALAGFGAIRAIGDGSTQPPALVELTHRAPEADERIALVGKGITFDSGGLSLKSPAAMQTMRLDCAGAAAILAVMAALPRLAPACDVHAVLPFAENLPGPGATRPGDVVTSWNGTQIQILDTDFEGRVVLADALAVAVAAGPDLVVDLATLTYQAEIALGPQIGAVLGRDAGAVRRVLDAADAAGEAMWPLPWAERYLDQVRTPFGVRNHPLRDSGRAITAALFLGEFVPPDTAWAHCDMAGPAWSGDASGDNATGFGARTLLRLLATRR